MTHQQIERQDIIDRYLLEKLSTELREDFEEHYIGCRECVERLESSREWIADVRGFAQKPDVLRPARTPMSRRAWGLAAALLALGILVVARRPKQHQAERPQQPAAPPGQMPIIELRSFRGATPAQAKLAVAAAAEPFSLRLDIRGLAPFLTYSVYIVYDSGKRAWSSDGIGRINDDWVEVKVAGAALGPGGYWVRLAGIRPGEPPQLLREYSLVVGP